MPLLQTIFPNPSTEILVWKITESEDFLRNQIKLKDISEKRLAVMKSELHRRGFLCVRMLLAERGYSDVDLSYDDLGKPHLPDHKYISITHSHEIAAIAIGDISIGIDVEMQREKILKIADKFAGEPFLENASGDDLIKMLTVVWGAKESIFKIVNIEGISFKDHIMVESIDLKSQKNRANLKVENLPPWFEIFFCEVEDYMLVLATIENPS